WFAGAACAAAPRPKPVTMIRIEGAIDVPGRAFLARALELAESNGSQALLVLLDTPDIDSITRTNWELAKSIREAGDVLIGILTGQKYADMAVVEFFREALKSGRRIIPLMNMTEDADAEYRVTRRQLEEFREYVLDGREPPEDEMPAFTIPRLEPCQRLRPCQPVALDGSGIGLMNYLESLDAIELKRRILAENLEKFTEEARLFFSRARRLEHDLDGGLDLLQSLNREVVNAYLPKPGREFITVVYEFIQKHASAPDRLLGSVTAKAIKMPGWVFRKVKGLFIRQVEDALTEQDFNKQQVRKIEELVAGLYSAYSTRALNYFRDRLPEAGDHFEAALRDIDPQQLAHTVAVETLTTENYIGAYRDYAYKELETRWADKSFRRSVRRFYHLGLLGSWGGVVVLLSTHGWVPGLGLSEILASLGVPVMEHIIMHGASYLWGDKLAGLVTKWQALQRNALRNAIELHLTQPSAGSLAGTVEALRNHASRMEELNDLCRKAF
ncbi:MAG: hypothetical protein NTZ09_06285, partial [Candidatus Hydrogenedentes bacterium]|nr:hypothetical protein [Candidatus Hydrogenedentota bacterium]